MDAIRKFLLAGLLVFPSIAARAGVISEDLKAALSKLGPGDFVNVIVRCADPVDLDNYRDKNLAARRRMLIGALQQRAKSCEKSLQNVLAQTPAEPPVSLWIVNGIASRVPVTSVEALAARPGVASVSLDGEITLSGPALSGAASGDSGTPEWNIRMVRAPELWNLGYAGAGVVVAAMDTGVDPDHPDIGPKWRGGSNSWYDPNGEHPAAPYDGNGHGTRSMGILVGGASGGSAIGMAPSARWIAVKIFKDDDTAQFGRIHQGFQWLLDPDGDPFTDDAPDVVNNSWYLEQTVDRCNTEFASDIAVLKAVEIAVVFSAGNTGPNPRTSVSPSNDPLSLAVGAVDANGNIAGFSSRGPSACDGGIYPRVAAPGAGVRTADRTFGGIFPDSFAYVSGTSFAAPHVAGGMALLKGAFGGATVSQIESSIHVSALDLGASGPDDDSGFGLLDLFGAYTWLAANIGSPAAGKVQFASAGYSVDENTGAIAVTVVRSGGSAGEATVNYATSDNTALAGADYQAGAGTLTFLDGETSRTFTVAILDDAVHESDENLTVSLANPTGGASLGSPATSTLTIMDDDTAPSNDADGDGYDTDVDCDDRNAAIHPGAAEIKHDGIDQDCNGYDLGIDILTARYSSKGARLVIEASSDLRSDAKLQVAGYGAMKWNNQRGIWIFDRKGVGGNPGTVTVTGVEGSESAVVEAR
jgi:serine protease AprX